MGYTMYAIVLLFTRNMHIEINDYEKKYSTAQRTVSDLLRRLSTMLYTGSQPVPPTVDAIFHQLSILIQVNI